MKCKLTYRTLAIAVAASLTLLTYKGTTQVLAQAQQSYPPPQSGTNQPYPNQGPMMGPGYHRGGMWGWGPGHQYGGMYDPNTVETIRGKVISTNRFTPMSGMAQGMELIVQSGERTIPVHVGPWWYLESQGWQVTSNEEVEVTGSLVNWRGTSVMMASELRHDGKLWQIRNRNGIPLWSGSNQDGNRPGRGGGPCCW